MFIVKIALIWLRDNKGKYKISSVVAVQWLSFTGACITKNMLHDVFVFLIFFFNSV